MTQEGVTQDSMVSFGAPSSPWPVCVPHPGEAQEDDKRVRKVTETGATFMASPDPFIRSKDGIWGLAMVQQNPRKRETQFYEFSDLGFLCLGFLRFLSLV